MIQAVACKDFIDDEEKTSTGAKRRKFGIFLLSHAVAGGVVRADDNDSTCFGAGTLLKRPEIDGPFAGTILERNLAQFDGFQETEGVEKGIGRTEGDDCVAGLADEFDKHADGLARRSKKLDVLRIGGQAKCRIVGGDGFAGSEKPLGGGFISGQNGFLKGRCFDMDAWQTHARRVADTQVKNVFAAMCGTERRPRFMTCIRFEVVEGGRAAVGKERREWRNLCGQWFVRHVDVLE